MKTMYLSILTLFCVFLGACQPPPDYGTEDDSTEIIQENGSNATRYGKAQIALTERQGDVLYRVTGRFGIWALDEDNNFRRISNDPWWTFTTDFNDGDSITVQDLIPGVPLEVAPISSFRCYADDVLVDQNDCIYEGSNPDPFQTEEDGLRLVELRFTISTSSGPILVISSGDVDFELDVDAEPTRTPCPDNLVYVSLYGTPACVQRCGKSCGCDGPPSCGDGFVCAIPTNSSGERPSVCVPEP